MWCHGIVSLKKRVSFSNSLNCQKHKSKEKKVILYIADYTLNSEIPKESGSHLLLILSLPAFPIQEPFPVTFKNRLTTKDTGWEQQSLIMLYPEHIIIEFYCVSMF